LWNYDSQIPIYFQLYKLQNYVHFAWFKIWMSRNCKIQN
jgi:hypothetical protein